MFEAILADAAGDSAEAVTLLEECLPRQLELGHINLIAQELCPRPELASLILRRHKSNGLGPALVEALSHHWRFPEVAPTLAELCPSQVRTWIDHVRTGRSPAETRGDGPAKPGRPAPAPTSARGPIGPGRSHAERARGPPVDGQGSLERGDRRRPVHLDPDGEDARQLTSFASWARRSAWARSSSTSASAGRHHRDVPGKIRRISTLLHDRKSTLGMIPSGLPATSLSAQYHRERRGAPWSHQSQSPTSSPPP